MLRRNLGIAMMAGALCIGCGEKEGENSSDNANPNSSMNNMTPNGTPNNGSNGSNNTPNNNVGMMGPWSAELTGDFGDLDLPASINGDAITTTVTDDSAIIGGSSVIGVQGTLNITVEGGLPLDMDLPTSVFGMGFTQAGATCINDGVTIRFTQLDPAVIGTFEGPIICGSPTAGEAAMPYNGTVSGRFEKN